MKSECIMMILVLMLDEFKCQSKLERLQIQPKKLEEKFIKDYINNNFISKYTSYGEEENKICTDIYIARNIERFEPDNEQNYDKLYCQGYSDGRKLIIKFHNYHREINSNKVTAVSLICSCMLPSYNRTYTDVIAVPKKAYYIIAEGDEIHSNNKALFVIEYWKYPRTQENSIYQLSVDLHL